MKSVESTPVEGFFDRVVEELIKRLVQAEARIDLLQADRQLNLQGVAQVENCLAEVLQSFIGERPRENHGVYALLVQGATVTRRMALCCAKLLTLAPTTPDGVGRDWGRRFQYQRRAAVALPYVLSVVLKRQFGLDVELELAVRSITVFLRLTHWRQLFDNGIGEQSALRFYVIAEAIRKLRAQFEAQLSDKPFPYADFTQAMRRRSFPGRVDQSLYRQFDPRTLRGDRLQHLRVISGRYRHVLATQQRDLTAEFLTEGSSSERAFFLVMQTILERFDAPTRLVRID